MVWEEIVDDEGRVYYYNEETEKTQWQRPDEFTVSKIDGYLKEVGWERYTTDDGDAYYYNEKTEESLWELPEAVRKRVRDEVEWEGAELKEEETDSKVEETDSKAGKADSKAKETELKEQEVRKPTQAKTKTKETISLDSIEPDQDLSVTKPHEVARDQFMEMLESKKVDSSWPYSKVMEECISDDRYWQVIGASQRKEYYEVYLVGKAKEEFERVEQSKEQYKKIFYEALKGIETKYYTAWPRAYKETQQNVDSAVIPKKLKRQFFDEYVSKLRSEHDREVAQRRESQLQLLEETLSPLVRYDSRFEQVTGQIGEFPDLTPLDILKVYEGIMVKREAEFNEKYAEERKKNLTVDRVARDRFKGLLSTIKVSAQLRWHEFVGQIGKHDAFVNLCGHQGSSPIDFYWDILDRENRILHARRDLCRQELLAAGKANTDEAEFVELMSKSANAEVSKLSADELKQVYPLLTSKRKPEEADHGSKRAKLGRLGYGGVH